MWFPFGFFNRVISNLESRNINYISIDKNHNYEEMDKMNYKNLNKGMIRNEEKL